MSLNLYQHEETGRMTWSTGIGSKRWVKIPIMYEDELPESMTDEEYSEWYENSCVVDGVRMGPKVNLDKKIR